MGRGGGGKQLYLATSREDMREAHTILASYFIDSLCSLRMYTPQSISNVLTQSGFTVVSLNFGSFSQTEIISHAQEDIISTDADIMHFN